jgi:hypothetical protein
MSVKGDKTRVTNFTRYRKNYTKIFQNWKTNTTQEVGFKKKRKVEKSKK